MIVVWNQDKGDVYGFADLAAYETFARKTEGQERTCWDDHVFDVGQGGKAKDAIDLHALKCAITDAKT